MHKATAAHVTLLLAGMALVDGAQAVVIQVPGERAGHWDTSLMINWVEGESLNFDGDGEGTIKDSWGWGIGIHYNFDNHWNLGFDMAFNQPDYKVSYQDPDNPDRTIYIDHSAYRFDGQLNGQYNILRGPITPYLQAGLGWTYMDSNVVKNYSYYCGGYYYPYCAAYANTFDDTSFSWNVGVGLRWDVTDEVFLKAAVIQQWIDTDGSPSPVNGRLEVGLMF
ncbi:MAG: porin family protein [Gammaproteobacteria bacterium]|nr:porin family protein [Gammaproteobacteria bacterium]